MIYGESHQRIFNAAKSSKVPVFLYGKEGSGRTYLAEHITSATGLPATVVTYPGDVKGASHLYFVPAFRRRDVLRALLLDLNTFQLAEYGLSYLSPVAADWAVPLAQGSAHKALELLSAKQRAFKTFHSIVRATNSGDVVRLAAAWDSIPSHLEEPVRVLLSAWVLSELDSYAMMIDQERHLPYPPSLVFRSHGILTSDTPPSLAIHQAMDILISHQRGS